MSKNIYIAIIIFLSCIIFFLAFKQKERIIVNLEPVGSKFEEFKHEIWQIK